MAANAMMLSDKWRLVEGPGGMTLQEKSDGTWLRTTPPDAMRLVNEVLGLPDFPAEVLSCIRQEWERQDARWGPSKQQSLPGYLAIIEYRLVQAKLGWLRGLRGRDSALAGIAQAVSVGLRCLKQYGITGNTVATNDRKEDPGELLAHHAAEPKPENGVEQDSVFGGLPPMV
jgi:hypothetical protein